MAEEKRLSKRIETLTAEAKSWEDKAAMAVRAGDDALAREALARKAEKETERAETQKSLQEQEVYVDQLAVGLKALDARVKDVKLRQGSLREKARASKRGGSAVSTKTSAFDDFERMSSKIDAVEAEASLGDELSGRTPASIDAERKLNQMSEKNSMDDALAELKKKLNNP
jgi:phage shock protein A